MENQLVVSIAPHVKDDVSTGRIMWAVVLSLIPAGAAGAFVFGLSSIYIIAASIFSAVVTEIAVLRIRKKDLSVVYDGSAVLTGLLLAYNLPPESPIWLPAAGSFFAIAVAKQVFGGLGHNIFNPALAGRAFLMVSWPAYMTVWHAPRWAPDTVTSATPLAIYRHGDFNLMRGIANWDLFIGNRPGCIGEICVAALILGAAFLFIKRYITWHIPASYIAVVALASWIFNGKAGYFTGDALFFVLSGGLILGAFFMATDYVTSPLSARGKIVFGAACGVLTFIIRKFSGYPEGVSYAILIMNALTPLIDKYTFPRPIGWRKR